MGDELVTVRNCSWLHEAELVKSVLDAEGIAAEIPDEHAAGIQPFYGAMQGGIRVLVREADLARAEETLKATLPPSEIPPEE